MMRTVYDRPLPAWVSILLVVLGAALLALSATSCRTPYQTGWRTLYAIQQAGEATDKSLAKACRARHEECLRGQDYQGCIRQCQGALRAWTQYGRPSVNAALIGAVTALRLAEERRAGKVEVRQILRRAACALVDAAWEYRHLSEELDSILRPVHTICKGEHNG